MLFSASGGKLRDVTERTLREIAAAFTGPPFLSYVIAV
jgi:hypothetical protein